MNKLEQFRDEINHIDKQLVQLLGHRFTVCAQVAEYKKDNQIPMMQPARIELVKERCRKIGEEYGVDHAFIDELYTLIIGEACRLEDRIIG